jgi:hypothetical protein
MPWRRLMYRRLFLSGLVLCVLPSLLLLISSVRTESTWSQTYGGAESCESAWSVIASSEGGYAICGSTAPSDTLSYDFWLIKTDEFGVVPEFPSWLTPTLILSTTGFFAARKKRVLRLH